MIAKSKNASLQTDEAQKQWPSLVVQGMGFIRFCAMIALIGDISK